MTKKCNIKVGGAWKNAKPMVKVDGVWKGVKKGLIKVDGAWKVFYQPGGATAQMSFDATTFKTNPTGCLAYTSESTFKTPVLNKSTTLAKATQEGDWAFDTTSGENKFGMFYCTFTSGGKRHQKLNPYNLAQYIATWDGNKWVAGTGSSSITTENTMLMIPTLYWKDESNKVTLSTDSTKGTAYAHTIGGKTYKWLAIGVYGGYTSGSKLMSLSGVAMTGDKTRATFRTEAQANKTGDISWAGLWNYSQWSLLRYLAYFSAKSFNGQTQIGQGGNNYNTGVTGGCNALGPYAGDVSGTASSVKCLIEDFWGYKYQFVDDCLFGKGDATFYVGQNASPQDSNTSDKVGISWPALSSPYFPTTIFTGNNNWGLGSDCTSGLKTVGLCDYQYPYYSTSAYRLLYVGGFSNDVSYGGAGPGYAGGNSLDVAAAYNGARLAFVLD